MKKKIIGTLLVIAIFSAGGAVGYRKGWMKGYEYASAIEHTGSSGVLLGFASLIRIGLPEKALNGADSSVHLYTKIGTRYETVLSNRFWNWPVLFLPKFEAERIYHTVQERIEKYWDKYPEAKERYAQRWEQALEESEKYLDDDKNLLPPQ